MFKSQGHISLCILQHAGPQDILSQYLFGCVKITDDSFLGSSSFIYSGSILWLILSPESRPELSVGPQHILAFLTCVVSVGPHLVDLGTRHL